jgi:acrylyl-CoA reductase (NADPH)/3-hydroxypropionyl-CoA dehydratase/3-hydroxypropionyl-CoA synthetase
LLLFKRLTELVRQEKGALAVPGDWIEVSQFPETRSGKYMRRFLGKMFVDEPLGDTTTLRNPESLNEIQQKTDLWKRKAKTGEEQKMFESYRFFLIQYVPVTNERLIAGITMTNPPVNALNERALDEFNTILEHLSRREDVGIVVFTGQGTNSFVAGADVKQFLEEMHEVEDVLPIAKKAHRAFERIENLGKPFIVAVNGVALGGGNELQMAAHYRVAEPFAEFGQPEINLHLIPGYGGTQRLPRLLEEFAGETGVQKALEIILSGRKIDALEAKQIGLIDEIAEETDAFTQACQLAREYLLTQTGRVHEAYTGRIDQIGYRNQPREFPSASLERPEIQRLINQAKIVGREKAVERALNAIRCGYEDGFTKGMEKECVLFAEAVIDPEGGKKGIQAFIDKKSQPLPIRRLLPTVEEHRALLSSGELLPPGSPFFPGYTPIPKWQYAHAVTKSEVTGAPDHGDPIDAEKLVVVPIRRPQANEALLYVLASEVNFNDIWAITGIPVSLFDEHDEDVHITGSGGVALVAALGLEARKEGRLKVGDLVTIFSGQNDLLSPMVGLDPMAADFSIQGYQGPDGSHQQFMIVQAPQVHAKPQDATLEAAGSYILNLGTIYRALFTTLQIQPGKTLFVEGAATGTGSEAAKAAARNGLDVTGMVSSKERAESVKQYGAKGVLNRKDDRFRHLFTRVPSQPDEWTSWEREGEPLVTEYRRQNEGRLADYVVSHAGELSFPRSFQLLEENGILTFYGASSGYHFTFIGKKGSCPPQEIVRRAKLRAGEGILIYYGVGNFGVGSVDHSVTIIDTVGLEAIEAARETGANIVVAAYKDAQKEFIQSLGYGEAVKGVFSIEEIARREGPDFDWPETMRPLPDPKIETEAFKEAVRWFNDRTFKPFGSMVAKYLRSPDNPRGYADVVFDRAGHDALSVSTSLIKPFTGRVIYSEEMAGRRYCFYAPQVWMRQRRIYMPTASIYGTHLCNAYEVVRMNEMIEAGQLEITEPEVVPFDQLAEAHQAMWENRHSAANYVVNHALPGRGLKTKEQLFEEWSMMGAKR